jgi:hypothetical protein
MRPSRDEAVFIFDEVQARIEEDMPYEDIIGMIMQFDITGKEF